jgi:hypothetical protein
LAISGSAVGVNSPVAPRREIGRLRLRGNDATKPIIATATSAPFFLTAFNSRQNRNFAPNRGAGAGKAP